MNPWVVIAAAGSAVVAAAVMWRLVPPTPRLRRRVGPYLVPSGGPAAAGSKSAPSAVFGPILSRLARAVGQRLDPGGEGRLSVRLRQADYLPEVTDAQRVAMFHLRQLRSLALGAAGAGLIGASMDMSTPSVVGMIVVGAVAAVGRNRGRVERAIENRRTLMRIEIYSVDQLLALRVRAGGGVVSAVGQLVERGRGEVVAELREALRLHRSGMSVGQAFGRVADLSPEPACARTYRLLAMADERGVDLAVGLLALAEDVRETRREAMKRAATRRRAAMLVPTIALLAPTLLLFVAAPLPYLLTGWR